MRKSMNHFTHSPSQAIANAPLEINRYPIVSSATYKIVPVLSHGNNNKQQQYSDEKERTKKGKKKREEGTKHEKRKIFVAGA